MTLPQLLKTLVFSTLSFGSFAVFADAAPAPAAAAKLSTTCVAFTWSETDGNAGGQIGGVKLDLTDDTRTEIFRTKNAIYQAIVRSKTGQVSLDVLDLNEKRIGAADGVKGVMLTLGTSRAEPGLQTQFECFLN